jgi:hypothetical protein
MTAPHSSQLDPARPPSGAGVAGVAPAPEQPIARRSGAGGLLSSLAAVVRDVLDPPALYLEFTDRRRGVS